MAGRPALVVPAVSALAGASALAILGALVLRALGVTGELRASGEPEILLALRALSAPLGLEVLGGFVGLAIGAVLGLLLGVVVAVSRRANARAAGRSRR